MPKAEGKGESLASGRVLWRPFPQAVLGSTMAVARRLVFFLSGYEPLDGEAQHRRFAREIGRFATTWNVKPAVSAREVGTDPAEHRWTATVEGPNWHCATDYRYLAWDDIVRGDFRRSGPVRLARGLLTLVDFNTSGTVWRYFRTNWRYALFALFPLVLVVLALVVGLLLGQFLFLPGEAALLPGGVFGVALLTLAVPFVVMRLAAHFLFFDYMLDDWIFAADLVREQRPDVRDRLDRFAAIVAAEAKAGGHDEILIIGHSLGAVMLVETLRRVLAADPDFARRAPAVAVMTVGSSLLKVGLHPKAKAVRNAVDLVSSTPDLFWIEYQSLVDIINFYKTHPAHDLGLSQRTLPMTRTVRMRRMFSPESYQRFKRDFFRLHRQFVMGNEARYFYDYFMIVAGPLTLRERALHQKQIVAAFAPDGRFRGLNAAPPAETEDDETAAGDDEK